MGDFKVDKSYEVTEITTSSGDKYSRVYDNILDSLLWRNNYKQYQFNKNTNKWEYFSERKGYVSSDDTCWLEIEYQKYVRIEKLKRIIDEE